MRRGNLWAGHGPKRGSRSVRAVTKARGAWRRRWLGGPEWLEPRTMLSVAALSQSEAALSRLLPPIGGDDFYWTPADTRLEVDAPGLLANDVDPEGERLEAVNLYGNLPLEYGMLYMDAWRNDGSFDYQPYPGAVGRDTFFYYCCDPEGWLIPTVVTIDVGIFNRAPFLVDPINDVTVDQGAADTVIDLAPVFDDFDIPRGDELTYTVSVTPPIIDVVDQVTQSSYEYIHQDLLFTHLGDDRGYHPGDPPPGADHDTARDNIANYFQSLGLITTVDYISEVSDFSGTHEFNPPLANVVGVKLGATYPEQVYLVGAHYDSVGNPGADDNASGTAAVMEIARVLSQHTFDRTLVFVAFDGEEMGLYGSWHYVEFHDSDQTLAHEGTHDGEEDQSVLVDSTASWTNDALVGYTLTNLDDESTGTVTANTATTITAVLSGGSEDDWDAGDSYRVEFVSEIIGMVNLDMIAYNHPEEGYYDVVTIYDTDDQGNVKPGLVGAFEDYGDGLTGIDDGIMGYSDHEYFDFFGIDAALVIESAMGNTTLNPHYHQATDAVETPDYIDYEYATKITRAVTGYLAQSAKPLGVVDVLTASVTGDQLTLDYDPAKFGGAVITVRAVDSEGLFAEDSFAVTVNPTGGSDAQVVARHIFYDNSYWDGDTAGANVTGGPGGNGDDGAIASDKSALLPGGTATAANFISYSDGITGIMVDVAGLADPAAVGDGDFSEFDFRYGNDTNLSGPGWTPAPAPTDVAVRDLGGGVSRVSFFWGAGAIPTRNWLQLTMKADAATTGLAQDDVLYFGGAAGDANLDGQTLYDDVFAIYAGVDFATPVPVTDASDINRDGKVLYDDIFGCYSEIDFSSKLEMIAPPVPPSAPQAAAVAPGSGEMLWAAQLAALEEMGTSSDESEEEEGETAAEAVFAAYGDE